MKGSQCRIHLRQWCADLYPSEATVLRCMDLRYIGGQDSRISWLFQPKMAIIDISLYLYIYSILSGDPKVLIFRQSKNKTIRTLRCTFFLKAQQRSNRTTTSSFTIVPLGRKISVWIASGHSGLHFWEFGSLQTFDSWVRATQWAKYYHNLGFTM
jgi:hypothetical protein